MKMCMWCSSGCEYCTDLNLETMELKELQKKYEELGKKIEVIKEECLSIDLNEFKPQIIKVPNYKGNLHLEIADFGEYAGKCIWLDTDFEWRIEKDRLIPTKKK